MTCKRRMWRRRKRREASFRRGGRRFGVPSKILRGTEYKQQKTESQAQNNKHFRT